MATFEDVQAAEAEARHAFEVRESVRHDYWVARHAFAEAREADAAADAALTAATRAHEIVLQAYDEERSRHA